MNNEDKKKNFISFKSVSPHNRQNTDDHNNSTMQFRGDDWRAACKKTPIRQKTITTSRKEEAEEENSGKKSQGDDWKTV